MEQWDGVITYGEHSIVGTVFHQTDSGRPLWYGFGKMDKIWPMELLRQTLETNIGDIIITNYSIDSIEFKGSGLIRGPLEEAINKNK